MGELCLILAGRWLARIKQRRVTAAFLGLPKGLPCPVARIGKRLARART
jgi:hypothetical protein